MSLSKSICLYAVLFLNIGAHLYFISINISDSFGCFSKRFETKISINDLDMLKYLMRLLWIQTLLDTFIQSISLLILFDLLFMSNFLDNLLLFQIRSSQKIFNLFESLFLLQLLDGFLIVFPISILFRLLKGMIRLLQILIYINWFK